MRWFLVPILLLMVLTASAQNRTEQKVTIIEAVTVDGKLVLLKSDGTWEYSKEVATVVAKTEPKNYEEVNPDKLVLFFDDYINKNIKFDVYIAMLRPIPDSKDKNFTIAIKTIISEKIIGGGFYKSNDLNIVIPEKIARNLSDLRERQLADENTAFLARVYAQIIKSDGYKIANVGCIEMLSSPSRKVLESFGNCK